MKIKFLLLFLLLNESFDLYLQYTLVIDDANEMVTNSKFKEHQKTISSSRENATQVQNNFFVDNINFANIASMVNMVVLMAVFIWNIVLQVRINELQLSLRDVRADEIKLIDVSNKHQIYRQFKK